MKFAFLPGPSEPLSVSAGARFGYGLKTPPAPAFVGTVKIQQAGFTQTYDTVACVKHWLGGLMARKIIPLSPRGA